VIDTHCHLTFPDFHDRVPETLAKAAEHGVSGCITVSTTSHDCLESLALAERFPNVWCSAGIHPLYADPMRFDGHRPSTPEHSYENLVRVASHPRCVAWGELGLDNHYPEPAQAVQRAILERQLELIASLRTRSAAGGPTAHAPQGPIDKPIIIHCREAFADLVPMLRASGLPADRFVFHCFTGTPDDARAVLDFGAWISFTGVITYKNASAVRKAAALVPIDRVMVETDAPFLPPEPHRSARPCEPWMTSLTAWKLAEIHGLAWDTFHSQLNDNTRRFFGI
jgi:TatD DNase family protein